MSTEDKHNKKGSMKWLKSMGLGAFLFFLIKGLIWLAIFFGLGTWFKDFFS